MAAMSIAPDLAELKISRGSQRQKSLLKDREDYQRILANRSVQRERTRSARASRRLAQPHRVARVAARSWLAKGVVQAETDMPTVSIGHPKRQKPSASRLCQHWGGRFENNWDEDNSEVDTSAPEFSAEELSSQASSPTFSFANAGKIPEELLLEESLNLDTFLPQGSMEMESEEPLTPRHYYIGEDLESARQVAGARWGHEDGTAADVAGTADTPPLHASSYGRWQTQDGPWQYKAEVRKLQISYALQTKLNLSFSKVNLSAEAVPQMLSPERVASDVEDQSRTRRESILKEVVTKLRTQAREAEQQAEEAQARAIEMEKKVAAQNQEEEKEKRAATLKLAKAMDRQRAQKLNKQVEQERRKDEMQRNELEAVKAQAEEEKMAIRQQALSEVAAMKAKARAARARVLVAAKAEAQVSVRAEAESLRSEAERLAESAQAEAASLRAEAESMAETIRANAAADAKELLRKAEAQRAEALVSSEAAEQKLQLSYGQLPSFSSLPPLTSMRKAEPERSEAQVSTNATEHELQPSYGLQSVLTLTHAKSEIVEGPENSTNRRGIILKEIVIKLRQQAREAEQQAEDAKAQALEFEQQVIAQQQKQEIVSTLKLAKAMDQQRARKVQKQAEEGRRKVEAQRIELEAMRAQAEEENRVIKQRALSEAAAIKTKAKSDAHAARARAFSAARAEAQERASAEAASLRAEAEHVAEAIKAKLAADADELFLHRVEEECAQAHKDLVSAINSPLEDPAPLNDAAKDDPLAVDVLEEDWHVLSASEVEDDGWDVLA